MKKILYSVICVCCFMVLLSASCQASEWINIYTSSDYTVYYGKYSLGFLNNNPECDIVCVWVKHVYDDAYARKNNTSPDGDTYVKTLVRDYMFDMNIKKAFVWQWRAYDKNEKLLSSGNIKSDKAIDIDKKEMKKLYSIARDYYQKYHKNSKL